MVVADPIAVTYASISISIFSKAAVPSPDCCSSAVQRGLTDRLVPVGHIWLAPARPRVTERWSSRAMLLSDAPARDPKRYCDIPPLEATPAECAFQPAHCAQACEGHG